MRNLTLKHLQATAQLALGLTSMAVLSTAQAGLTDISQAPLLTASGTPVKPNLLFVLDDSGSMDYEYLPEDADFAYTLYGSHTAHCNGLAYNAKGSYPVQVDATGVGLALGSIDTVMQANNWLTDAINTGQSNVTQTNSGSLTFDVKGSKDWDVGTPVTLYDNGDKKRWMIGIVTAWDNKRRATIDISDYSAAGTMVTPYIGKGWPPFVYFTYPDNGGNAPLGYTYDDKGKVDTTTSFYTQCNSTLGASPGSSAFTRYIMRPTSPDAQKMANWWAYYRSRMAMMKTVVSLAFKDIDDKFRVGYSTIWNKAYVEGQTPTTPSNKTKSSYDFLEVRDFDATQKANFYRSLSAANPGDNTPLRGALSNAGRYFARKLPGQVSAPIKTGDPIQYSCQKNFTLLATDGAWNTGGEVTKGSNLYGPYQLNGTSKVGQQDGGSTARPMHDASTTSGSGGSSDSLADIAMYFYSTDLRDAGLGNCIRNDNKVNVCENNVKPFGKDTAEWQHMTTYTMSLGQNGTLKYDPNYEKSSSSGDFAALTRGDKNWPNPSASQEGPANIDDLWHAAVNGRGTFFNAADPAAVAQGLKTALVKITEMTATGAAAATSTLRPVVGNNQVFVARFTSAQWTGDLRAYRMNVDDGSILISDNAGKDLADWGAAAKLKNKTDRKIYFAKGTARKDFTYANVSTDFAALFQNACGKLTQCAALSTADKATANDGDTLVKYLRGTEYGVFRAREQVLGDIVGSSPVFVGASPLSYADKSYAAFAKDTGSRRAVVYVGANDGMLHAFDAANGDELWAWVPTTVMANMYKLADQNYSTNHQYFVDGAPTVADVKINDKWRTVLIGGLGGGGRGYFAIDVTNPLDPQPLWEFTDTNLGLSFASPLVVQRSNSNKDWVVVLSSGYNNGGDGKGHLFMLDAGTGAKLVDLSSSDDPGTITSPSGLGPLAAWVDGATDGVAKRFYAGDTLGNLWRFDPDGVLGGSKMVKLASLTQSGKAQSITTAPVPAEISYKGFKTPVVFVGTGRMLGLSDVQNTETQSIYGIKDTLASSGWGDIRAGGSLVKQTLANMGTTVRGATNNPVDWASKAGWYVDLPDLGERINVEMMLRYNTLIAGSNVPKAVASCNEANNDGYAWLYNLDIASGSNVGSSVATKLSGSMVVGLGAFELVNGVGGVVVTYSQRDPTTIKTPKPRTYLKTAKKSAWRELTDR